MHTRITLLLLKTQPFIVFQTPNYSSVKVGREHTCRKLLRVRTLVGSLQFSNMAGAAQQPHKLKSPTPFREAPCRESNPGELIDSPVTLPLRNVSIPQEQDTSL